MTSYSLLISEILPSPRLFLRLVGERRRHCALGRLWVLVQSPKIAYAVYAVCLLASLVLRYPTRPVDRLLIVVVEPGAEL